MKVDKSKVWFTAALGEDEICCAVCGDSRFSKREMLLNTAGASFLGFDWANESAVALVCKNCGYVHPFVGNSIGITEVDTNTYEV